jgi:demethoxyubiquinone hydroxylase (CLK1/Coq7/Cat5 family)
MLIIKLKIKMDTILENIEELIDDLERDDTLTRTEITETLYKIKEEIEQYRIKEEEHQSISWDDLDNY